MDDDAVTPADLARELGVSQKRIRDFLRSEHGTLQPPTTRWRLGREQADEVRVRFRSG